MFKDQNEIASYAVDAVKWAAEKGFVKGDDKGYFHPNSPVTRQDLCVILKRLYDDLKQGAGTTPTNPTTPPTQPQNPPTTQPPKQPKTEQEIEKLAKDVSVHVDTVTGGTAVLLKNGYVLTAKHVSKGNPTLALKTKSGGRLYANLVSEHPDKDADIALYRVDVTKTNPSTLPSVPIGSSAPTSGEKVVTVQANYLDQVYRKGQICRTVTNTEWEFDASLPVEHGNSGGAVINQYGELIGIVVQLTSVGVQNGSVREVVPGCEAVNLNHAYIRNWLQPYGIL